MTPVSHSRIEFELFRNHPVPRQHWVSMNKEFDFRGGLLRATVVCVQHSQGLCKHKQAGGQADPWSPRRWFSRIDHKCSLRTSSRREVDGSEQARFILSS